MRPPTASRREPTQTVKTKKIPRNHVKSEATDKHPAQVEVYHEDVVVGYWRTTKFSGALPSRRVNELLERVEKLSRPWFAREEANNIDTEDQRVGEKVFRYLFSQTGMSDPSQSQRQCASVSFAQAGRADLAFDANCLILWESARLSVRFRLKTGRHSAGSNPAPAIQGG